MTASRKPDFRLKVLDKETDRKGVAGAGWANPDGSISIVPDFHVALMGRDKNVIITLFPEEPK